MDWVVRNQNVRETQVLLRIWGSGVLEVGRECRRVGVGEPWRWACCVLSSRGPSAVCAAGTDAAENYLQPAVCVVQA